MYISQGSSMSCLLLMMRLDRDSSTQPTLTLLATKRLYEQECDITPLEGPPVVKVSTLIPFILASVFFIARMIAKSSGLAGGWGWDDYTIIVSYVSACRFWESPYMFWISTVSWQPLCPIWQEKSNKIKQYFQAMAVMYKVQISLAKISVCLFLLRIFQSRTFRYLAYALIGINASIGITWASVDAFRCVPTRLTWTGWTNEESGYCINFIVAVLVNCLVNIFVDFVLIVMPVYEVVKLQLPLRKKIAVASMFIVGSVLTIIAIIRVVVFWNNRWGANETLGLYPLMHWSVIECQISVMCACLPASRALIGRWWPGLLGGSSYRKTESHAAEYYNKKSTGSVNINKSVTYTVNYESRSATNSDVELVDIDPKHGK
ncbi:Pc22g22770 [Penicillium rubens Wisconsin 54-1255]|uniref:Pc22g22770 protein n=1 Tax=Penicillium rubens (strain ATCC 28089 / DSM 1075 / NRRL 1951 / Wisconsin 54-1255) TaxID=500485 RepID=B6HUP9_PENRW|nr:Pc22g22770 [Penicillium rubens Wisconsin 54-1255]